MDPAVVIKERKDESKNSYAIVYENRKCLGRLRFSKSET